MVILKKYSTRRRKRENAMGKVKPANLKSDAKKYLPCRPQDLRSCGGRRFGQLPTPGHSPIWQDAIDRRDFRGIDRVGKESPEFLFQRKGALKRGILDGLRNWRMSLGPREVGYGKRITQTAWPDEDEWVDFFREYLCGHPELARICRPHLVRL
jgi:hypothetical protein